VEEATAGLLVYLILASNRPVVVRRLLPIVGVSIILLSMGEDVNMIVLMMDIVHRGYKLELSGLLLY
jgi:hypothetical protein